MQCTHARSVSRFRSRLSSAILAGMLGGGLADQALAAPEPAPAGFRRLPVREYRDKIKEAVEQFASGWKIDHCGTDMDPGLRAEWAGKKNVLCTHPLDPETGCVLTKTVAIPAGKTTKLHLVIGHDPQGDFDWAELSMRSK